MKRSEMEFADKAREYLHTQGLMDLRAYARYLEMQVTTVQTKAALIEDILEVLLGKETERTKKGAPTKHNILNSQIVGEIEALQAAYGIKKPSVDSAATITGEKIKTPPLRGEKENGELSSKATQEIAAALLIAREMLTEEREKDELYKARKTYGGLPDILSDLTAEQRVLLNLFLNSL